MENRKQQVSDLAVLEHLSNLRKMMVHHHELENLSEFVLHELCAGPCFHVDKAAYFVNNPDFKILRGVTGYSRQEAHAQLQNVWDNQKQFIASKNDSFFNQKVRNHAHQNFDRGSHSETYMVQKLADDLEIANPAYHVWNLKHANHGLLIYEPTAQQEREVHNHHVDALYYLSFCPIY